MPARAPAEAEIQLSGVELYLDQDNPTRVARVSPPGWTFHQTLLRPKALKPIGHPVRASGVLVERGQPPKRTGKDRGGPRAGSEEGKGE